MLRPYHLAWTTRQNTIEIGNHNGKKIKELKGHKGFICHILQLSDGRLISRTYGGRLHVWDVEKDTSFAFNNKLPVNDPTFLDTSTSLIELDDKRVATAIGKTIFVCDLSNQTFILLEGHSRSVTCLLQLSDRRLASGSLDCSIRIWNLETEILENILRLGSPIINLTQIFGTLFSESRHGKDSCVRKWNLETRRSCKVKGAKRNFIQKQINRQTSEIQFYTPDDQKQFRDNVREICKEHLIVDLSMIVQSYL